MERHGAAERVLGIVGGTGPESTIDYYRSLVATWRRRRPDGSYPRVIIDSIEAGRVFASLAAGEFDAVGRELGPAVAALAAAGCQRALLASNASHLAFELIDPPPSVELIHIVDAARDEARRAGYRRLGLIGTRFVVESDLYPARLAPDGIQTSGSGTETFRGGFTICTKAVSPAAGAKLVDRAGAVGDPPCAGSTT